MNEENCIICLEEAKEEAYSLAEKFGCNCKTLVHEECLTTWILNKYNETGSIRINCLQCREEVLIDNFELIKTQEIPNRNLNVVNINNNNNIIISNRTKSISKGCLLLSIFFIFFILALWLSINIK